MDRSTETEDRCETVARRRSLEAQYRDYINPLDYPRRQRNAIVCV